MIGKDASDRCHARPVSARRDARILVTPVDLVQPEEKLVREKLCPVLGFARVGNIDQAISSARSMMRVIPARGHSAAIHSRTEANILAFAAALPALRVAVNAGCSLGAAGFETNLGPSMTIGTGFVRRFIAERQSDAASSRAIRAHCLQQGRRARRSAISPGSIPSTCREAAKPERRPGGQQFRHRRTAPRAAQDHPRRAGRGSGGVSMATLRSFIFLDQLQPQTMCCLGSLDQGLVAAPPHGRADHRGGARASTSKR